MYSCSSEFDDLNELSQNNPKSLSHKKSNLITPNPDVSSGIGAFNYPGTNDGSNSSICEAKLDLLNQIGVTKNIPLVKKIQTYNLQRDDNYWRNNPHVPDSEYYSHGD